VSVKLFAHLENLNCIRVRTLRSDSNWGCHGWPWIALLCKFVLHNIRAIPSCGHARTHACGVPTYMRTWGILRIPGEVHVSSTETGRPRTSSDQLFHACARRYARPHTLAYTVQKYTYVPIFL
jgi:hypothetical protein